MVIASESAVDTTPPARRRGRRLVWLAVLVVIALGIVALVELRPSHKSSTAGSASIDATVSAAETVSRPDADKPHPQAIAPKPKPVAKPVAEYRNQSPPSGSYASYISIPAQGVVAPIEGPCVRRNGGIEPASYDPRITCYWDRGAMLGATQGETTILGHINYNGINGSLGRIGQLHIGDSVYMYDFNGKRSAWKVSAVVQRPKVDGVDPTAEKGPYGPRELVMVTCGGAWVGGEFGYADLFWVHAVPA